ncbi:MAG: glycosyltransferase family 2 protein, partial [Bradymonadaceae bacterium]
MTAPLISIITPCYNAAASLPTALASLLAQTYSNWECLLIDDGSEDDIEKIVEHVGDERIRFVRLAQNQGRAVARQTALDAARGEFLCMLDADDWYYPDKTRAQLEVMEQNPDISLLSMGMAVIDGENQLLGVRTMRSEETVIKATLDKFDDLPFGFPPSMIRMEVAREVRFDERLRRSEDWDYLNRVLKGRTYGFMTRIGYAYNDAYSADAMREAITSFGYHQVVLRDLFWTSPVYIGSKMATT